MSSIADRIAALKLSNHAGQIPVYAPPSDDRANAAAVLQGKRPRPPPPPPPVRAQTSSVPPVIDHAPAANRPVGNHPEAPNPSGMAATGTTGVPGRPPLPARKLAGSSSAVPALPWRAPSGRPTPPVVPRRPSEAPSQREYDGRRRTSTDSTSSVATARSSVSAISNATSLASQTERYKIRAPDFDPSVLPPLPPKRTNEEKEAADRKYAGLQPLRQSKSSPKVTQVQQGTTPPPRPARPPVVPPPALPSRQPSSSTENPAIETAAGSPRVKPPPAPPKAEGTTPRRPRQSALSFALNKVMNDSPPTTVAKSESVGHSNGPPPPIPTASKPNLASKLGGAPTGRAQPVAITSYNQFSHILSSTRIVVSDFYADWCEPCRKFAPDYERLSIEYSRAGQIAFVKINTDHNQDIAQAYKIECWPTLIIFEGGAEVEKFEGASEHGLVSTVEELAHRAGLDMSARAPAISSASTAPPYATAAASCLHCRDFSAPDNHAARFPRDALPSHDIGWLAHQLTSPFPSYTDKARAIFTWLHHNIAYNTEAFFANNVQSSTPQSTLATGLAVCEGYAGLFTAMAVKVGMESYVISGASKGFGYVPLQPGQAIPPFKSTHAWNAVKIDHGEWKLIDSCWGAGNVSVEKGYEKSFKPERFTQSNDDFGLDHFPEDSSKQLRNDGQRLTWEEFSLANKDGCAAQMWSGYIAEEGLAKTSFQPQPGKIVLAQQGPLVRFSFQKICPHWDPVRCGKGAPYVFLLHAEALENTPRQFAAFDTNGSVWWCDVPVQDLGRPGQKASIYVLTMLGNRDGRGVSVEEYRRQKGKVGASFGAVATWEVA